MRVLPIILSLSVGLTPSLALGQVVSTDPPPVTAIPAGEDRIVPLRKGEVAPFDGQFFDQNTALRWGNYLEQYRFRLKLDAELNRKITVAQENYYKSLLAAEQAKYTTVVGDLQVRLAKAESELRDPPWYKTTWFGVVVGVASTAAVFSLSVWALEARN